MSANVETMAYAGQVPWHGLGQRIVGTETVSECIEKAGLNWSVELQPLSIPDGRKVDSFATVRSSDKSILGVVGHRYCVLQNKDAFAWFQPFLDAKACTLHIAGSLDHGRRVWVLAHVSGSNTEVVAGDRVDAFILLSHSHDGTMAVRAGFTPIRVVCANTLAVAHSKSSNSKLIRFKHTKSLEKNLEAVRDVMNVTKQQFEATLEQYRLLANRGINQKDVRRYVKLVLDIDEKLPMDEVSTRARNQMLAIEALIDEGTGNKLSNVHGTWWAAYNGLTEYLSYGRQSDAEKRLGSLWFGSSAEMNRRALAIATEMSQAV